MADLPTPSTPDAPARPPVVVKKYANRRLYNTETSSYITLDNLADMIRAGRDFVVYDAKSGDDITRGVLTQIIVEEESKGSSMLPTTFLRQLIGFYGDSLQGVVPSYLEHAMSNFARQQQQMRQVVQQTFGPFMPVGVEEMSRQNIAMMERAMSMFNPFLRGEAKAPTEQANSAGDTSGGTGGGTGGGNGGGTGGGTAGPELEALRHEVESLRAQLAIARAEAVVQHAPIHPQIAPPSTVIPPNVVADAPAAPLAVTRVKPRSAKKS